MTQHIKAEKIAEEVRASLEPHGLFTFGWFRCESDRPALLLGDVGGSQWPAFSASPIYSDGKPDPLNRWTTLVIGSAAKTFSATPLYPFGEVVYPFQQWAMDAMKVHQSPIGLLIHPTYGLWMALRGALIFDREFEIAEVTGVEHPCETCRDKPCLKSCPVEAFSMGAFDVDACRDHVRLKNGRSCREKGCIARQSCPVGSRHVYPTEQQAFHMAAFL